MKRREKIEDALSMLDDGIIEEFCNRKPQTKRVSYRLRGIMIAAAALVMLTVAMSIGVFLGKEEPTVPPIATEDTDMGETDTPTATEGTRAPDTEAPTSSVTPEPKGEVQIVSVKAKRMNGSFIKNDTSFEITTLNGSLESLKSHIAVTPAINYTVTESGENTYELTPDEPIPDNTLFKLASVKDKVIIGSWAFQTEEVLSISGTYPANGNEYCSVSTVYELYFSYADVSDVPSHVTFEPHVDGSWEHVGKTWRFTPSAPLEEETVYKVLVSAGITCDGMEITEDSVFTFGTKTGESVDSVELEPRHTTVDMISTYRPGEAVTVSFSSQMGIKVIKEAVSSVSLKRFANADSFLRELDGYYEKPEELGTVEFELTESEVESSYGHYIYNVDIKDVDTPGYYVATLLTDKGSVLLEWAFQINPVSAYVLLTSQEMLIWTAIDGEIAPVDVDFRGERYTTDESGVLKLDLRDVTLEGGEFIRLGEDPQLLIGVDSLDVTYRAGYIYTDLSAYRPSDTMNVWGFVPTEYLPDGASLDAELVIGDGIERIPLELDGAGSFCASYVFKDFDVGTIDVRLELDGHVLAKKTVRIAKYEEQNYKYELTVPENCIERGEDFVFEVKVTHLSGIAAAGKRVHVSVLGNEIYTTADDGGIARFSIGEDLYKKKIKSPYPGPFTEFNIFVFDPASRNKTEVLARSSQCYIITAPEQITHYTTGGKSYFNVGAIILPEDGNVTDLKELDGGPVDRTLTVEIYERVEERYIDGYRYNKYTKENEPVYRYRYDKFLVDTFTCQTVNGEAVVDLSAYDVKDETEDLTYSYTATARYDLADVKISSEEHKFLGTYPNYETTDTNETVRPYFQTDSALNGDGLPHARIFYGYRLALTGSSPHLPGNNVESVLECYDGSPCDEGRIMRIVFTNEILDATVLDAGDDLSFTYSEELLGGAVLTGAYFKDGVFHRLLQSDIVPSYDDMELDVTLETDKSSYAPGDTVELKARVTYKNGESAAGVSVNLSVMNTAVGNLPSLGNYRSFYGIGGILQPTYFKRYVYSTYRDYDLEFQTGLGGGAGGESFRDEFFKSPYFGTAVTDENGEICVSFKLDDSITEYTVTAHAVNNRLYSGVTRDTFTTEKELFIETFETYDVKTTDDLVILANVLGDKSDVAVTFGIVETGQRLDVNGVIGETLEANFGKLPVGEYTVEITASAGSLTDAVRYKVAVIENAQSYKKTEKEYLDGEYTFTPSASPTHLLMYTETYERYARYLDFISSTGRRYPSRKDVAIAFAESNELRSRMSYGGYSTEQNSQRYVVGGYLFAPLPDAEGDRVLTALALFMSEDIMVRNRELVGRHLEENAPCSLTEAAELTLLAASVGKPVLADLIYLSQSVQDNDYIEILLALGYIMCGDYEGARELYYRAGEDSGDEGYRALKAFAATYVDRDAAGEMLDSLAADEPSEYLLCFALLAYMNNGIGCTGEEASVTVTHSGGEEIFSFGELERAETSLVCDKGESVTVSSDFDGIVIARDGRVSLNDSPDVTESLTATLSESTKDENGFNARELTIDLSQADDEFGVLTVILPDALMTDGVPSLPDGYYVMSSNVNVIEIRKYMCASLYVGDYNPKVTIKLLERHSGDFSFERLVLVTDKGRTYASNEPTAN